MLSEDKIIEGCKKNSARAQRALYNKYAPLMRSICFRYSRDKAEASDMLQEGFIKIFSKIDSYQGKGSFEGWLKRVMINTSISHYKKAKKHYFHSQIEEIQETKMSGFSEDEEEFDKNRVEPNEIDPKKIDYSVVDKADFSEKELLEILQQIPEKYRKVFCLHVVDNFKHKDIAEMLDIDEKTSRSRLSRARVMIQKEVYQMSISRLVKS